MPSNRATQAYIVAVIALGGVIVAASVSHWNIEATALSLLRRARTAFVYPESQPAGHRRDHLGQFRIHAGSSFATQSRRGSFAQRGLRDHAVSMASGKGAPADSGVL